MPAALTYPGVYIEEIPSGVRTITGVATSITAFVGRALRGPIDADDESPVTINSFGDFERIFGGLWLGSTLGYAVRDFFLNGGSQAIIVRLYHPIFAPSQRAAVAKAASDVATAAKGAADGAGAKTAAAAVVLPATASNEEKQAAKSVLAAINALPDTAAKADVAKAADAAVLAATPDPKTQFTIGAFAAEAAYPGTWATNLRVILDLAGLPITSPDLFNLTVRDSKPGGASEQFLNVSADPTSSRYVDKVLEAQSTLLRGKGQVPNLANIRAAMKDLQDAQATNPPVPATIASKQDALWLLTQDSVTRATSVLARATAARVQVENSGQDATAAKAAEADAAKNLADAQQQMADSVSDGLLLTVNDFLPQDGQNAKTGIYSLAKADIFNLLCIPPYKDSDFTVDPNLIAAAVAYCEQRRAVYLLDPPNDWTSKAKAKSGIQAGVGASSSNAAIFFPRLQELDPLRDNRLEEFAPCGAVAGIFARTDTQRGVWKAPAGLDATLAGVPQLAVSLTDAENGELNPLGVNCLRAFPVVGCVVWGARTLRGADQLADEYKYIPVRRTALYIEESLYRGTQWVVFEPNDEPLWAQIRLNVGAFMHTLFRQGAFQGQTPKDAYFVKCDKETTPQDQINLGIVNIVVGFAPLKPAEFVVIQIQQMAGQIET